MNLLSTSMDYGLGWPAWLAAAGGLLFCLLALYAATLHIGGKRPSGQIRHLQLPTLRGRMILALTFAATLPAISLALILSERTAHTRLENVAASMAARTSGIARMSDYFVGQSLAGLMGTARHITRDGADSPEVIASRLLAQHRTQQGFDRMLVMDTSGRVVAATALFEKDPRLLPAPDGTLHDRAWFRQPLNSGLPHITDALIDEAFGAAPTVAIGVPVTAADGSVAGIVAGSLRIAAFENIEGRLSSDSGAGTIVTDQSGRVIFSHGPIALSMLDPLAEHVMLASAKPTGQTDVFGFEIPSAEGTSAQPYIAARAVSDNGWTVHMYLSLAGLEAGLLPDYAVALTWLVLALAVSVCLALALANSVSRPLQALDAAVTGFSLDTDRGNVEPPEDAPREVRAVFEHLGDLTTRLRASYSKLRNALQQGEKLRSELIYVVANREKEIKARTKELQVANAALERANREDSLTGLANRRRLAEFLDQTWRSAMRENQPIGFLLIDIDHFKTYNDTYGHQVGDNCLKAVADAIRQMVTRGSDLAARYGGEEFIVVLGNTSLEGALKVGENIRQAVENLGIPHEGSSTGEVVTVSVGATSTVPTRSSQPDSHLVAADRALYNAKDSGRNRVAWSTTSQTGIYQTLCLQANDPSRPS